MADDTSADMATRVIGGGSIAFGVMGVLAPTALARAYGMRGADPAYRFMAQLWGTSTGALGVLMLTAPASERRKMMVLTTVVDGVNALVAFTRSDVPTRSRLQAGLTSSAFAAVSAAVLASGSDS